MSKPIEAKSAPAEAALSTENALERSSDEAGKEEGEERARRPFSNTRADSPQAKGEKARSQVRVSVPPSESTTSTSRWLVLSLAIAALIMGGRLYFQNRNTSAAGPPAAETPTAPAPAASEAVVAQQAAPTEAAPERAAAATASAAEASAAPSAAAAPAASTTASTAAAAPSAAPDAKRIVIVKISPPGARLFYHGKPAGSSPVTLELAPGERRAFEVGMPGWVTRRLVVDGTKPEVFIGLKPEK